MRAPIAALALCVASATGASAQSAVVFGEGLALSCYQAAKTMAGGPDPIRTCTLALELEPLLREARAGTLVNRGVLRLHRKDAARALADFDAALALTPDLAEAHVNRGAALILAGEAKAAVAALDKGLALGPADPHEAHFNRGLAHEALGDVKSAYEDYLRAQALKPDWPLPAQELARFTVSRR